MPPSGAPGSGTAMKRSAQIFAAACGAIMILAPTASRETFLSDAAEANASDSAMPALSAEPLAVGDRLDPENLHMITRPGLYGLAANGGDRFGLLDGKLLRYDPATMHLRAIIRTNVATMD